MSTAQDGRGGRKRFLPVVTYREGWGLVRVGAREVVEGRDYRRGDCVHLAAHELEFSLAYYNAQGRCPEGCGAYRHREPTGGELAFAMLLARRGGRGDGV